MEAVLSNLRVDFPSDVKLDLIKILDQIRFNKDFQLSMDSIDFLFV